MAKSQQAKFPVIKGYRDQIENKYQWCIAAVPGEAWAKKLFPGLREVSGGGEAVGGHPVHQPGAGGRPCGQLGGSQQGHAGALRLSQQSAHPGAAVQERQRHRFPGGHDPEAQFCGGSEKSLQGIVFNPNIPTEECFISPMRGKAEGIVYATKPLSYQGQLIDGFWIRFHEGKAVEWHAQRNNELLTKLITMDDGSAYLGECALVPYDSPICQSGLLFYNTLFDENAACHLALAWALPTPSGTLRKRRWRSAGRWASTTP